MCVCVCVWRRVAAQAQRVVDEKEAKRLAEKVIIKTEKKSLLKPKKDFMTKNITWCGCFGGYILRGGCSVGDGCSKKPLFPSPLLGASPPLFCVLLLKILVVYFF